MEYMRFGDASPSVFLDVGELPRKHILVQTKIKANYSFEQSAFMFITLRSTTASEGRLRQVGRPRVHVRHRGYHFRLVRQNRFRHVR